MKTWSLGDVLDVFKRVERITRPPRKPWADMDTPLAESANPEPPLYLPWEVVDLRDHYTTTEGMERPWGITDGWGRVCARIETAEMAHAAVDAVNKSSADGSAQGPADGPAGGVTHSPESSPAGVPLATWLEPAIWTALAKHEPRLEPTGIYCAHPATYTETFHCDWQEWREHVGKPIAAHIAQALPDFQK